MSYIQCAFAMHQGSSFETLMFNRAISTKPLTNNGKGAAMRTYCLVYFLAFAMFGPVVFANGAEEVRPLPKRQEGTFVALDFRFQSGETLPELKLAYTTFGTPQRDSSGNITNAVLLYCTAQQARARTGLHHRSPRRSSEKGSRSMPANTILFLLTA